MIWCIFWNTSIFKEKAWNSGSTLSLIDSLSLLRDMKTALCIMHKGGIYLHFVQSVIYEKFMNDPWLYFLAIKMLFLSISNLPRCILRKNNSFWIRFNQFTLMKISEKKWKLKFIWIKISKWMFVFDFSLFIKLETWNV